MIEQSPLNLGFQPLLEAALDATEPLADSEGEATFPYFRQLM
jgi:hypothetical protein